MKPFVLAAAAALLVLTPALAKPLTDPNAHVLHDMVLTMPKLKAYDAAYGALTTAAKADKSLAADLAAASSEQDPTIADTIAKMDHHPRVYAFFQKQGLGKPEAALMPLVLMEACTAVQYPQLLKDKDMAAMVGQPQVDFCKANMAAIKTLHFMSNGH